MKQLNENRLGFFYVGAFHVRTVYIHWLFVGFDSIK